jgi:hypothetical protein
VVVKQQQLRRLRPLLSLRLQVLAHAQTQPHVEPFAPKISGVRRHVAEYFGLEGMVEGGTLCEIYCDARPPAAAKT